MGSPGARGETSGALDTGPEAEGAQKGGPTTEMMNAQAILVADRTYSLQLEAAERRLEAQARKSGLTRPGWMASLVAAFRTAFTGAESGPVLPNLADYPFRS